MARSRNIKPGFFVNDLLGELPPKTRILFIALWGQADRDGRLEDRPKRIKVLALSYDEIDTDEALSELHRTGFIERYQVEGIVHGHTHKNSMRTLEVGDRSAILLNIGPWEGTERPVWRFREDIGNWEEWSFE